VAIRCGWKAATHRRTRTAIRERLVALGRVAPAWRLPWHQSGDGMAVRLSLGLQQRSRKAVLWALVPIALGHATAIALTLAVVGLVQLKIPFTTLKFLVAAILFALGLYRVFRSRHPRGAGMRVGFRDLTVWSFLMASTHGAGLMLAPVLLAPRCRGCTTR